MTKFQLRTIISPLKKITAHLQVIFMTKKRLSLFQPIDLTEGTCWKTIFLFSIPIIISYLLQQIYTISDAAIVGQTLSSSCNSPSASAQASAR